MMILILFISHFIHKVLIYCKRFWCDMNMIVFSCIAVTNTYSWSAAVAAYNSAVTVTLSRVKTRQSLNLTSRTMQTWHQCRAWRRHRSRLIRAWNHLRRSLCHRVPWCIGARPSSPPAYQSCCPSSHPPPTTSTSRSCLSRTSGIVAARNVHPLSRSLNRGIICLLLRECL